MTFEEFSDGMLGIFAYDTGATDSGIHDEGLRARLKEFLQGKDEGHWLERLMREAFLSDEALAQGYRAADVAEFVGWLSSEMDCDL